MDLAGVGIWSSQLHYGDVAESAEAAAELEELGFTALWIPDVSGSVLGAVERLLAATARTVIATGILNLWMHEAGDVADSYAALTAEHGDRFLLGIGVSHGPLIDAKQPGRYGKPLAATASFLDGIDVTGKVPTERRVLAALGPKMLTLSAERAQGAHPYLVNPEHTAYARSILGEGPSLMPEQGVILCDTYEEARRIGTDTLRAYLSMPNYANNMMRSGFSEYDVNQVSDRLFDALIAWGDEEAVMRRVSEHQAAGADHVCVQVLTEDPRAFPREEWRRIAAALK